MNASWSFLIDDEMPRNLGTDVMFPPDLPGAANLCNACETLNFGNPGFQFTYQVYDLKQRAPTCGLCKMLWDVCEKHQKLSQAKVKFERYSSTLKIDDENGPVLSIIRSPGMSFIQFLRYK